jgi:hypothetical protein
MNITLLYQEMCFNNRLRVHLIPINFSSRNLILQLFSAMIFDSRVRVQGPIAKNHVSKYEESHEVVRMFPYSQGTHTCFAVRCNKSSSSCHCQITRRLVQILILKHLVGHAHHRQKLLLIQETERPRVCVGLRESSDVNGFKSQASLASIAVLFLARSAPEDPRQHFHRTKSQAVY